MSIGTDRCHGQLGIALFQTEKIVTDIRLVIGVGREEEVDYLEVNCVAYDEVLATSKIQEPGLPSPISCSEMRQEQANDEVCQVIQARLAFGERITFGTSDFRILERHVVDRSQADVPKSIVKRLLTLVHHTAIAAHPRGRKLYRTLRRSYY